MASAANKSLARDGTLRACRLRPLQLRADLVNTRDGTKSSSALYAMADECNDCMLTDA